MSDATTQKLCTFISPMLCEKEMLKCNTYIKHEQLEKNIGINFFAKTSKPINTFLPSYPVVFLLGTRSDNWRAIFLGDETRGLLNPPDGFPRASSRPTTATVLCSLSWHPLAPEPHGPPHFLHTFAHPSPPPSSSSPQQSCMRLQPFTWASTSTLQQAYRSLHPGAACFNLI